MKQFILLLRGINVGGIKILMSDLKEMLSSLGFENIQTYIQTGNIILHAPTEDPTSISKKISLKIKERFGYDIEVFVSSKEILEQAILLNPFKEDMAINQDKVYFALIKERPDLKKWEAFQQFDFGVEKYFLIDQFLFWYSPLSFSDSILNNNYFENKLKITATTRNMKTIRKIISMASL